MVTVSTTAPAPASTSLPMGTPRTLAGALVLPPPPLRDWDLGVRAPGPPLLRTGMCDLELALAFEPALEPKVVVGDLGEYAAEGTFMNDELREGAGDSLVLLLLRDRDETAVADAEPQLSSLCLDDGVSALLPPTGAEWGRAGVSMTTFGSVGLDFAL